MKAEELMIGDWVFAYGKKTQIVWVGNIHKMAVRGFPSEFMDGENFANSSYSRNIGEEWI